MNNLPADYDVLSVPLFSLPKEFRKENIQLKLSRYKKLPPIAKSNKNTKVHKTQKRLSYTALRKEREEFRKRLVKLIIRNDDIDDDDTIPSSEEKEFLRYYYYIHHGIDTVHVAPLEPKILKRVYNLISSKLLNWQVKLRELTSEMKEDYLVAVKKAIVDFVLQDSSKAKDKIVQYSSNERTELKTMSADWKNSFVKNRVRIRRHLNVVNPNLAEVINIWHRRFSNLRLINTERLAESCRALTIAEFESEIREHLTQARAQLTQEWTPAVRELLWKRHESRMRAYSRNRRRIDARSSTSSYQRDRSFLDSVACVMERQLQQLCLNSARDYADYMSYYGSKNRGIQINILLKKDGLVFEPSFKKIQTILLDAYKYMVRAVKDIPRLDTGLCAEENKTVLRPIIPEDLIEKCRKEVYEILEDNRIGPELLVQDFDQFIDLINGNIQQQMDTFFASDHPFEEYCELIEKFGKTSHEIPIQVEHVVTIGLYEMHREELVKSLINAAVKYKDSLINWMITDYQEMMKTLSDEYQAMSVRALTVPADTAQLMSAAAFVRSAESGTLAEMQNRLREVVRRLLFLSDHHALTTQEIKQNTDTFQWYLRMPSVFEEHRQMADIKTAEFQRGLKVRIVQFGTELQRLDSLVSACRNWGDVTQLKKYRKRATTLDLRLILAMETIQQFNTEEASFGYELSSYPLQQEIHDRLKPFKNLYDNCGDFLDKYDLWMKAKIGAFPPDEIETEVEGYYQTVLALEGEFAGKHPTTKELAAEIRLRISEFRDHMPIVQTLGNQGMKPRHWEQVGEIVGFPIKATEGELTLEKVIDYGFDDFVDRFVVVSEYATKENDLEDALNTMMAEWSEVQFNIIPYGDTGTFILASIDEIQVLLDDHIVKTQTMKSSPYIKPFESIINQWEQKLMLLQEVLDEWSKGQSTWINFEPIFSSPDIQQQMPEEGRRFSAVDKIWRDIMKTVREDTKVLVVVEIDKLLERLKKCNGLLDVIRKGLIDYLEKKRLFFARFFFLANDELLDIISETKNPTKVQPHLRKCFEAVSTLEFSEEMDITKIISHDEEELVLHKPVSTSLARGQVEKWLLELETGLKESVKKILIQVLEKSTQSQDWSEWLLSWPGQAVQVVSMINWTAEVHSSLAQNGDKMEDIHKKYIDYTGQIIEMLRQHLTLKNRLILRAMLKLMINCRDILENLISSKVTSDKDFNWLSQLRYYVDGTSISVRVFHYTVSYGYEYLGNCGRLVITPLTIRCQRSVFGSIYHGTGSAPEGPAGTGKTETAKDLAKAVSRYCVVFNCSDRLDYAALGKFFKGLAACGAWCCFDEFSRLSLGVLSAAARYLQAILRAVRAGSDTVTLLDTTSLRCNPDCHVFITSSPPDQYRGRCNLPDNLKALFRPIAMPVADFRRIAEIELYTYGCEKATELALKLVTSYQLLAELLPEQTHYDFGLRNLKAVLRLSGEIFQARAEENEEVVIVNCIRIVNFPKLCGQDLQIYNSIINDIFPGVSIPDTDESQFAETMKESCISSNLRFSEELLLKVQQLYNTIKSRHGVIVLGPPLSGKTTICNILADTLGRLHKNGLMDERKVSKAIINPKAVTLGQLYGQFDSGREWCDGILAINYKLFAHSNSKNRKWLIFDGPVDASWVENLNTVLDDNKKLCLMSGEIVLLAPHTNLIFETVDLDLATPVTISRCSIVYLDVTSTTWQDLIHSWVNQLPESINNGPHLDTINGLFARFVEPLSWYIENGDITQMVRCSKLNLVRSLMNIFDCFVDDFKDEKYLEGMQELDIRAQIEGVFFFSCIWSFGGHLDDLSRSKFSVLFRALTDKEFPVEVKENLKIPEDYCNSPNKAYIYIIPKDGGSVFDYKYIKEGKGKWKHWLDDLTGQPAAIPRDLPVSQIIVPTTESAKMTGLLSLLIPKRKPVLWVGPTATGKTAYIGDYLMKKNDTSVNVPAALNVSPRTNAGDTQEFIMCRLDKRRKGIYGPPMGHRLLVFCDDLHLAGAHDQGRSPEDPASALELLRGWLDRKAWRDLKTGSDINIQDVQLLGAATVERKPWSAPTRFTGLFTIIATDSFNDDIIVAIYSKIVLWHLDTRGFSKEFDPCISELVAATLAIFSAAKKRLKPTPINLHYKFNLRDYTRVIQGVLLSVPESTEGLVAMKRHWVHEILRVYGDRITNTADKKWLYGELANVIKQELHEELERIVPSSPSADELNSEELDSLIFCDFTKPLADVRFYKEVTSMDALLDVVEGYLIECNNMSKRPMTMVLCRYNIEHLSRICRILKQSRGHVLLVGTAGSGRRSLAKLAAHINDFEVLQVEMLKNYTLTDWHQDIKKIIIKVSTAEKHCVFMLPDNQMRDSCYLDDTVSLLRHGEVPGLLTPDDRADAVERTRAVDSQREKTAQTDGTTASLYELFLSQVREQLHVIVTVSPLKGLLQKIARSHPAIMDCCTIDWFQPWPQSAFEEVALKYLENVNLTGMTEVANTSLERSDVTAACVTFHMTSQTVSRELLARRDARYCERVTPASYLEMLTAFADILRRKRTELEKSKTRYESAAKQLENTEAQIGIMQKNLETLKPQLSVAAAQVQDILAKVDKETLAATELEQAVLKEQVVVNKKLEASQRLKQQCDKELADVVPKLDEAVGLLNLITSVDLISLKTVKNPPRPIKLLMESLCLIKEVKSEKIQNPSGPGLIEDYWAPSKKMLSDPKFMETLLLLDKDTMPQATMLKLQEKIENEDFDPEKIKTVSTVAESFSKWVIALTKYDMVAQKIAPKKLELAKCETEDKIAVSNLETKRNHFKEVQDNLAKLLKELDKHREHHTKLSDESELCTKKLERAEELLEGYGEDKEKLLKSARELGETLKTLTGDVLISSGVLAYLGPFTRELRQRQISLWLEKCKDLGIECCEKYELRKVLGNDVQIRSWIASGLPCDEHTVENALITTNCQRWPLAIDPQGQANKWLKNLEKARHLSVVKLTQGDYVRILENSIQFGQPILLENVSEELDPLLDPLLGKQTFKQSGGRCMKLGETLVDYNLDFKLYMTTSLVNPHFNAHVASKTTILNFTMISIGLESKILDVVLNTDRPDEQLEWEQYHIQQADNKKNLQDLEQQAVTILSVESNILEDENSIQSLMAAKISENEFSSKKKTAETALTDLALSRTDFEELAQHITALYFTIVELSRIEYVYQYSLEWYLEKFNNIVQNIEKVDDVSARIKSLIDEFTSELYKDVARSLFAKDKLLFSFLLTINTLRSKGQVDHLELLFLLNNNQPVEVASETPHVWLDQNIWNAICSLNNLPNYQGIMESIRSDENQWRSFCIDHAQVPIPWNNNLNNFQKMLLTVILRPEEVISTMQKFVFDNLGGKFLESPTFELKSLITETDCCTPLLLLLTPGVDPTDNILNFAEQQGFGGEKTCYISLGEGQGPLASKMLDECAKNGSWAVLQNCHLAGPWMKNLERVFDNMNAESTHADFRLWMTSYPCDLLPFGILRSSVKITDEVPSGVRASILQSYSSSPLCELQWFEGCKQEEKSVSFKSLLYALCFHHAVAQQRTCYSAWNSVYEFCITDLKTAAIDLRSIMDNSTEDIPFDILRYLTGECVYGGRIRNEWDRRCLNTLLEQFYCQNVVNNSDYKFLDTDIQIVPAEHTYAAHIEHTLSLSLFDTPRILGLGSNAGIAKNEQEGRRIFADILKIQDRLDLIGKEENEQQPYDLVLNMINDILPKFPNNFDEYTSPEKYQESENDSLSIFLLQELEKYKVLLNCVKNSLKAVKDSLEGSTIIYQNTLEIFNSILRGRTPKEWLKLSYPSIKPLASYISDLIQRLQYFQNWADEGTPPVVNWISGLFTTRTYLTVVKANYAKRYGVNIHQLTFDFQVQTENEFSDPPSDGVYVRGLFLEGARWDKQNNLLTESLPGILYDEMPTALLLPTTNGNASENADRLYCCPLYRTADKKDTLATSGHSSNYVMSLMLPVESKSQISYWILRGVALVCELPL